MKKTLVTLIIILVAAVSVCAAYAVVRDLSGSLFSKKGLAGSGVIATQTFEIGPFTAVDASQNARVTLVKGSGPVTVKADDNVMPYVRIETRSGELKIGLQGINSTRDITFEVTVPTDGNIRSLDASGAARIIAEPVLTADEIEIESSGASKVVAMIDCRKAEIEASGAARAEIGGRIGECEAESSGAAKVKLVVETVACRLSASGAAHITASGSAHNAWIDASGASKVHAGELTARDCTVSISSASKASVHCTGTLKGEVSSAGSLTYSGDCRMLVTKSSAGSISKN